MLEIDVNNPQEVFETGCKLLAEGLGPVGFARFMQQVNPGRGDCIKDKYAQRPLNFDEIMAELNRK